MRCSNNEASIESGGSTKLPIYVHGLFAFEWLFNGVHPELSPKVEPSSDHASCSQKEDGDGLNNGGNPITLVDV